MTQVLKELWFRVLVQVQHLQQHLKLVEKFLSLVQIIES